MASRDFLGRFGGEKGSSSDKAGGGAGEPDEVVELSLGLSLGGCFGANSGRDAKKPRLVRSSSLAAMYSLPTETEEERWRRREMQSLKRLQAKRKRLERRTSMNSGKSGGSSSRDDAQEPLYPSAFQLRRSVVDQGNTSSSMPEQGSADGAEAKSTSSMEISSDNNNNNNASNQNKSLPPPAPSPAGKLPNGIVKEQPPLRTLRSLTMRTTSTGDLRKSMMEDMPMVSSKVDGPNGKKIDGFLYKYRKGEEVRIVCVCHGNFLTPAEFVKHAGGGDVTNPLRHIVVNPAPSVFL
uniref:Ninja-family protein n=1 Tax=Triticum aestivum TaxID=4565 RepID=A0A3B6C2U1_WHEAT